MRYALLLTLVAAGLAFAACGGSDKKTIDVPSPLAAVCSQSDATLSPDTAEITAPLPGATIRSPLTVSGKISALQSTFFISLVLPDGTHLIDYPGHTTKPDELVSFEQQVPFSYFSETPACLWVSRQNIENAEAVRIPVVIEPQGPGGATQGGQ
ncbi:MAG: Gmad2 immunoglobulin-like domain-containing protein [Chloroflexota bacterium]